MPTLSVDPADVWALRPHGDQYALCGVWRDLGIIGWIEVSPATVAKFLFEPSATVIVDGMELEMGARWRGDQ